MEPKYFSFLKFSGYFLFLMSWLVMLIYLALYLRFLVEKYELY